MGKARKCESEREIKESEKEWKRTYLAIWSTCQDNQFSKYPKLFLLSIQTHVVVVRML